MKKIIQILGYVVMMITSLYIAYPVLAQQSPDTDKESVPLFTSEEPLEFTLAIDVRQLKKDDSEDPEYDEGKLILHGTSEDKSFKIKVKGPGKFFFINL